MTDLYLTLVIDISGSMCSDVSIDDGQNDKLRINALQLITHTIRTLLEKISADKMTYIKLRILAFNGDVFYLLNAPTSITDSNKAEISRLVDNLRPDGCTNIEKAMTSALEFNPDGRHEIILLSDGEATAGVNDSEQLAYMIKLLIKSNCRIHTLGFGRNIDKMLYAIANVGKGFFGYIDDSTMAATVWGCLFMKIILDHKYNRSFNTRELPTKCLEEIIRIMGEPNRYYSGAISQSKLEQARQKLQNGIQEASGDPMRDDLQEQCSIALENPGYWSKWGYFFYLSVIRTHKMQFRRDFKMSEAYEDDEFKEGRFHIQKIFTEIPQSTGVVMETVRSGGEGVAENYEAALGVYVDPCGGCVGVNSLILMADGTTKKAGEIKVGDCINSGFGIEAKIEAVIYSKTPQETVKIGELLITPWHPIKVSEESFLLLNKRWVFPINVGGVAAGKADVVTFLLEKELEGNRRHTFSADGIWCAALAHGLTGEVIGSETYGTEAIAQSISKTQPVNGKIYMCDVLANMSGGK